MKIYGHPWSINTRKVLMTLAEKGHDAELVLVMIPKGEHKGKEHLTRHPFGKVPTLEDGNFLLYETAPINRYLDRTLAGPSLVPSDSKRAARVDQWIGIADAYFIAHAPGVRFLLDDHDARDPSRRDAAGASDRVLLSGQWGDGGAGEADARRLDTLRLLDELDLPSRNAPRGATQHHGNERERSGVHDFGDPVGERARRHAGITRRQRSQEERRHDSRSRPEHLNLRHHDAEDQCGDERRALGHPRGECPPAEKQEHGARDGTHERRTGRGNESMEKPGQGLHAMSLLATGWQ